MYRSLKRTGGETKEAYINYGKRLRADSLLYLQKGIGIEIVNLKTGEERTLHAEKKKTEGGSL